MMTPETTVVPFVFTVFDNASGAILHELPERFVKCDALQKPDLENLFEVAEILMEARGYEIMRRLKILPFDTVYLTHVVRKKGRIAWVRAVPWLGDGGGAAAVPPAAPPAGGDLRNPGI